MFKYELTFQNSMDVYQLLTEVNRLAEGQNPDYIGVNAPSILELIRHNKELIRNTITDFSSRFKPVSMVDTIDRALAVAEEHSNSQTLAEVTINQCYRITKGLIDSQIKASDASQINELTAKREIVRLYFVAALNTKGMQQYLNTLGIK